ncbi:MAG: Protein ViaA [Candidatus Erwinia impunctatus]|nr:Protein ViaA [Culicoides impunctatus]
MNLATLTLSLAINEDDLIDTFIVTMLNTPQLVSYFEKCPPMKQVLLREVSRWKNDLQEAMKQQTVPESLENEFHYWQAIQSTDAVSFSDQLPEILNFLQQEDRAFCHEAQQLIAGSSPATQLSKPQQARFIYHWRRALSTQTLTLNLHLLEQEKERLLGELQQRMTLSLQFSTLMPEQNEITAGHLWDLTKSSVLPEECQPIEEYSHFLATQPLLQEIAQKIGRSRTAKPLANPDAPKETYREWIKTRAPSPQEINGLHQSDDILRLLPPELANIGCQELEIEFYRRLVEKRLFCYDLNGETLHQRLAIRPVTHQQSEQLQPSGPMVICVDTSGSMGGFNERCAKAFCLALLKIALENNRRCFVILFAHQVISYELTAETGIIQAIRFLSQRFRGGTDLAGCLKQVLSLLSQAEWVDADAVIISDFIAQRLPASLIDEIEQHKTRRQQRFHAVTLSAHGKPGILRIFDHLWHFDTSLKNRLLRHWLP